MRPERIAVLGAGSWGATLATLLAEKGHDVSLWEIDPAAAETLRSTRHLPVLPSLQLPDALRITSDLKEVLEGRTVIVSATPSQFVRPTMRAARRSGAVESRAVVVNVAKGLEESTLQRMSTIIEEELAWPAERIAVLSGPSHAEEVCRRQPTAAVVASRDAALSLRVQSLFTQDYFRVYIQSDVLGVEFGGVLKNVFAIGCGISDGLGLGDNTKAAILTRGLNEMARLGTTLGAQLLTFFGLAGLGDLVVTGYSRHSRNRLFGEKVGSGTPVARALSEMTMVVEGYRTAHAAHALSQKLKLDCPLIREIDLILFEGKNPKVSLHDLMTRETQSEWQALKKGEAVHE